MTRALWYYWLTARAVLAVTWGYLWRGASFRAGVRAALARRDRFADVAIRRGVARSDLAGAIFGAFGELSPVEAINEATEVRQEAAADGFTTADAGLFRVRLQALNTLYAAVDLGLVDPTHLVGLVKSDGQDATASA